MILLFGGTTEGMLVQQFLERQKLAYLYSTQTKTKTNNNPHGIFYNGSLELPQMLELCRMHQMKAIVDATHPFATNLHRNVQNLARQTALPFVHYDRLRLPTFNAPHCHYVNSYAECIQKIELNPKNSGLVLSGLSSIQPLQSLWKKHPVYFKILPKTTSVQQALALGLPQERLWVEQADIQADKLWQWMQTKNVQYLIFKESGLLQNYKMEVIKNKLVQAYILKRPEYPKPTTGLQFTVLYSIKQLKTWLMNHQFMQIA